MAFGVFGANVTSSNSLQPSATSLGASQEEINMTNQHLPPQLSQNQEETSGGHATRQPLKTSKTSFVRTRAAKIWTERVILAQTPVWITAVGLVMMTGILRQWNDLDYLVFSLAVASPSFLLPALSRSRPDYGRPWTECYWFKLNVWVGILVFFGTYFGTHYFFDLMGMRYAFDVRWFFNSDVVGQSSQRVPLFMYPLIHAYSMSYYVALMVADRFVVKTLGLGPMGNILVVMSLAYCLAFMETYFMAADLFSDLFLYDNRARMLRVGSFGYASYFVVGLPVIRRMDENGESWSIQRVVLEALATCMAVLLLLEVWAKTVGPL